MSASAGFDIGNYTSCVSLSHDGRVNVLMNAEGCYETLSTVQYGKKRVIPSKKRAIPYRAAALSGLKHLIGKPFQSLVDKDLRGCSSCVSVCQLRNGKCAFRIPNQQHPLSPEQVMITLVKELKLTAQKGHPIENAVLAVPAFFTEFERSAMLKVAKLADLQNVRLMNDLTAAALNWAVCNVQFLEHQRAPISIAFVDVGHSSTQVCIADITSEQLTVRAHEFDSTAGGRDLDEALLKFFTSMFARKNRLEITSHRQSYNRLVRAVTTLREHLTDSKDAHIDLEDLMNREIKFSMYLDRNTFKHIAANVIKQVENTCIDALKNGGMKPHYVEMVGSASRTPAIEEAVKDAFQQPTRRTMNSKECISRGCAYFAEMQYNSARYIKVLDMPPMPIAYSIDSAPMKYAYAESVGNEGKLEVVFRVPSLYCTLDIGTISVSSTQPQKIAEILVGNPLLNVPDGDARESGGSVVVPLDCNHQLQLDEQQAIRATMTYKQVLPVPQAQQGKMLYPAIGSRGREGNQTLHQAPDAEPVALYELPVFKQVNLMLNCQERYMLDQHWKSAEDSMVAADQQQEDKERARNSLEKVVFEVQEAIEKIESLKLLSPSNYDLSDSIANTTQQDDWLRNTGRDAELDEYQARHDKMVEEKRRLGDMYEKYTKEEEERKAYIKKIQVWCEDFEGNPDTLIPHKVTCGHSGQKREMIRQCHAEVVKLHDHAKAWLKEQSEAPFSPAQCRDMWHYIENEQQHIWQVLQIAPKQQQIQHTPLEQEELGKQPEPCGASHVAGAGQVQLQNSSAEAPATQYTPEELHKTSDVCLQSTRPGDVQTNRRDTTGRPEKPPRREHER